MDKQNVEDIYKLSPTQSGFLFNTLYASESNVFIEQVVTTVQDLAVFSYVRAWRQVIERHPVLRTAFFWEDLDEPLQVVKRRVELPVEERDWRELDRGGRQERLEAFLEADRRAGFNISVAPLMRLALMRLDETTYTVVWTYHHILLDGWSVALLTEEIMAWYRAFRKGRSPSLPQPRPFRDYVAWLRQKDWGATEAFWRAKLAGWASATPLCVDHAPGRALNPRATFRRQEIRLSAQEVAAVQAFTRQFRITANTLVQAAWALLLHRYSGEQDLVFGVIVHGRPSEMRGFEAMIGLFINAIPVRVRVPARGSVLDWLNALQAEFAELLRYGYTSLVQIQGWNGIPRNKPMFDYVLIDQSSPGWMADGRNGNDYQLYEVTGYPLTVYLNADAGLALQVSYDQERFDDDAMARLLGHLRAALVALVAGPQQLLAQVSILSAAERHQLLDEWNRTQAAYPQKRCIHELFELQAQRTPDAVALVFPAGEDQHLTCRDLNHRANQLARHLQSLGVGPEALVAIGVERSLEMVVGILGVLKAGGAYLPLDPSYPRERLAFMLQDAQAVILLTQERLLDVLPGSAGAQIVCLDRNWDVIARQQAGNLDRRALPDSPAYAIYTSGSTGTPKGVLGLHRGAVNRFHWMWETYPFEAGEVCCQKTTLSFVDAVWEIWGPLLQGVQTVIVPGAVLKNPPRLVEALAAHHVTRIVVVPSLLREILEAFDDLQERLPDLRIWVSSGEALSEELARRFRERMPRGHLLNLYGSSEVSADATWYDTLEGDLPSHIPIGRPIANTQIYVLDRRWRPLPVGVPGELYVGGDGLARGYLKRPELTAERFIPNPFAPPGGKRLYRTGDLARYRPDGNVEFLGRADHQVKMRGFRIELGEIETALETSPSVQQAVVVAVPTAQDGERRLVAYVVYSEESTSTISDLRQFLRGKLPDYMQPAAFVTLQALPLTPNGKVDRKALPAPGQERPDLAETFVAARDDFESDLVRIFQDTLGVSCIGIADDFFELGGNSLLAVRLMRRVKERFGWDVPLAALFDQATVEHLAAILHELEGSLQQQVTTIQRLGMTSASGPRIAATQPDGTRPPFFCATFIGGIVPPPMDLTVLARHLGPDQPFYMIQPPVLYEDWLRQHALFQSMDDQQVQTLYRDWRPDPHIIRTIATDCVRAVQTIRPEGPYFLGGVCSGAILAFEMAQQLQKQGGEVALLFLLDATSPTQKDPSAAVAIQAISSGDVEQVEMRLLSQFTAWDLGQGRIGEMRVIHETLRNLTPAERWRYILEQAKAAKVVPPDARLEEIRYLYRVFKMNLLAIESTLYSYTPSVYAGQVTLVHVGEPHQGDNVQRVRGWGEITSEPVKTYKTAGEHGTMLKEPHVQVMADILRRCLDEAKA